MRFNRVKSNSTSFVHEHLFDFVVFPSLHFASTMDFSISAPNVRAGFTKYRRKFFVDKKDCIHKIWVLCQCCIYLWFQKILSSRKLILVLLGWTQFKNLFFLNIGRYFCLLLYHVTFIGVICTMCRESSKEILIFY